MPRTTTSRPLDDWRAVVAHDPLARAVMTFWVDGDHTLLQDVLVAAGRVVTWDEDRTQLSWFRTDADPRPGGGVVPGVDPVNMLVVALFAIYGELWPHVPQAQQSYQRVLRAWTAWKKAAQAEKRAPQTELAEAAS